MMKLFQLNRNLVQHTDARVKSTNEAVQGIRCVKMYTWEDPMSLAQYAQAKVSMQRNVFITQDVNSILSWLPSHFRHHLFCFACD